VICLDASLVISLLLPDDLSSQARVLMGQWQTSGETLIAPTFMQLEVASVLRNSVYRSRISDEEGEDAFEGFRDLEVRYYQTESLIEPAWLAAKRVNAPRAYDMIYFALAESLGCDLWTGDRRLFNLVSARYSWVRWTGNVTV
jgi:predicted nucleic acid-binding protein